MRRAPTLLVGLFLAIQITRVAQFAADGMGAGILGWIFSAGLAFGVFVSSYWMRVSAGKADGSAEDIRSQRTRRSALVSLVLFVAVDGFFNVVEVLRTLTDKSLLLPAVVYGVWPTLASGMLGWLQGNVDRLPHITKGPNLTVSLKKWFAAKLAIAVEDEPTIQVLTQPTNEPTNQLVVTPHEPTKLLTQPTNQGSKRAKVQEALRTKPDATNQEIADEVGVAAQYVGKIRRTIDGPDS